MNLISCFPLFFLYLHITIDLNLIRPEFGNLTKNFTQVARAWLTDTIHIEEVKSRLQLILTNEKLTAKLQGTMATFCKIWDLWVTHFLPAYFEHRLLEL